MSIYKFCENTLDYKKLSILSLLQKFYLAILIISISFGVLFLILFNSIFLPEIPLKEIPTIKQRYETIIFAESQDKFSEEKFIAKIKQLNIKHPHIALAQAYLESGRFTSKIFKENHNMFGMKQARVRINLAKGTQYGHAYFNSWEDCLLDYAYYRATYSSRLKTEKAFYAYLDANYAEDGSYSVKLKNIVKKYKLKEKF